MAVKIYTTKSGITRRLKNAGIKKFAKPTLDKISVMIEIDDHVLSVDRTQKLLEQKAGELLKLGVGKYEINKVVEIANEVAAERDFLSRLYKNTCGRSWTSHKNWDTSATLDVWEGIVMTKTESVVNNVLVYTNRVKSLTLRNNYLHGNYSQGARGDIPDDIEKLTCLEALSLHYNFLSDSLPSTLGNLRNLKVLHLEFNQIMGELPHLDHMDSLEELYLNHNRIEGSIDELTKLKKLKKCQIYHNKFSGKVPEVLADKKDLTEFKFYNNYMQIGSKVQARIKSDSGWQGRTDSEKPAYIVYE